MVGPPDRTGHWDVEGTPRRTQGAALRSVSIAFWYFAWIGGTGHAAAEDDTIYAVVHVKRRELRWEDDPCAGASLQRVVPGRLLCEPEADISQPTRDILPGSNHGAVCGRWGCASPKVPRTRERKGPGAPPLPRHCP